MSHYYYFTEFWCTQYHYHYYSANNETVCAEELQGQGTETKMSAAMTGRALNNCSALNGRVRASEKLSSMSATTLTVMEMKIREVENCSRSVPPRPKTRGQQSSSASFV